MIGALLAGTGFGLGLWLLLRWAVPSKRSLAETLDQPMVLDNPSPDTALRSFRGRVALIVLRRVKGDSMESLQTNLAVVGVDAEAHAVDRLHAALAGGGIALAVGRAVGWASGPTSGALAVAIGAAVAFWLPEIELRKKAKERRAEFVDAMNAFVTLVSVALAGGSGVNSAMKDTASLGGGWAFDLLADTLDEAALFGDSPWAAMDQLGRQLDVEPLIDLAGALSLAGVSGARVTDTLRSRAESGRQKALAEAKAEAESKSESMNMPIAAMLLGWVLFMGFPAAAALLGGS
jgi:Flp pilus assembly protein TadB